ncbi:MAG: Hsp20/alpha crystallin family protein [Candidatus Aenigmatarchaeota archaeon]
MAKPKKRPAFWFEEPYETARKIEEEFHRNMSRFWANPFEFTMPEMKVKVPHEFLRTIPIDVAESDGELLIKASLPGYEKKDVKLKVSENSVSISAQRKREEVTAEKSFYRREIGYGAASRTIPLPTPVLPETAKAKFEKGVLEITVKKAAAKKREKEIRLG